MSGQFAVSAGMTCIKNDDTKGAVPPGTYSPTLEIGTYLSHILKPLIGSILLLEEFNCDLQTNEIFLIASYSENFSSSEK